MATDNSTQIFDELADLLTAYEGLHDVAYCSHYADYVPSNIPPLLFDQLNKRFRSLIDKADDIGLLS